MPLARRAARVALLAAGDLAALVAAASVAYLLWALPVRGQRVAIYAELAPLLAVFVVAYGQAGLYPGLRLGPVERLRRFSYATGFVFVLLAAASFALKLPPRYSRVTFALALALSLLLVPVLRSALLSLAARWRWWAEPVLVVGPLARGSALARRLDEEPGLGYRAARLVDPAAAVEGQSLAAAAEELPARGVRVALVSADAGLEAAELDLLQRRFERVVVVARFGELPVEGVVVRNLGGVIGLEYTNNLLRARNRLLKRCLDLAFAGVLLLLALPVIAAAALVVAACSPGWPFFVQRRIGLGGRHFGVPKIRTMRPGAERLLEQLTREEGAGAEWRQHQKLRHDPRLVPGIGKLLRRYSIDELPQLWSVLAGTMSLVGPRPFPDYHLDHFTAEFRQLRQRVRPGITGLWQVTVRSEGGVEAQQALDTYYIRNWSLWLDLYVLARTVGAVLSGRGAF
jgi:Undecaprenyl-phosphate galactose phosphotransferase WbaP